MFLQRLWRTHARRGFLPAIAATEYDMIGVASRNGTDS